MLLASCSIRSSAQFKNTKQLLGMWYHTQVTQNQVMLLTQYITIHKLLTLCVSEHSTINKTKQLTHTQNKKHHFENTTVQNLS